ncbi:MAG: hypothetical protein AAF702_10630 [Chloroflexota bacterium]
MNNQTALSISLHMAMDDPLPRSLSEACSPQIHQQKADVVFVPELGIDLTTYLHRLITFLKIPSRLSAWLSSMISGAVSVL